MDLLGHVHVAWTNVAIETKLMDALYNQGYQCSILGLTSSCIFLGYFKVCCLQQLFTWNL